MLSKIISIDGNIGSGKSSIIRFLNNNFKEYCNNNNNNNNRNYNIYFLEEPVDIWESIIDKSDNKNIIEKFYENNEKYAFSFQMLAYISRLTQFKEILNSNIKYDYIFTERSIYTDKHIFCKMLYMNGQINNIEYQIYNKWFEELSKDYLNNIKTIYVKTSPEICLERINKRNRTGEDIDISYIYNCHNYHEDWLNNKENVLILNNDENNYNNSDYYNNLMKQIFNYISTI